MMQKCHVMQELHHYSKWPPSWISIMLEKGQNRVKINQNKQKNAIKNDPKLKNIYHKKV